MIFERRHQPLASSGTFYARVVRSVVLGCVVLGGSLGLGVLGYHYFARLAWLDALVNASMILAGMGPVDPVPSAAGKWFASGYAIFSGVMFLTSVGVMLAPAVHRFLHRFHLGMDDEPAGPRRRTGPPRS